MEKTRYDVLVKQLAYLQKYADKLLENNGNKEDDPIINRATNDLAVACQILYNDSGNSCPKDCRIEDGMCICD